MLFIFVEIVPKYYGARTYYTKSNVYLGFVRLWDKWKEVIELITPVMCERVIKIGIIHIINISYPVLIKWQTFSHQQSFNVLFIYQFITHRRRHKRNIYGHFSLNVTLIVQMGIFNLPEKINSPNVVSFCETIFLWKWFKIETLRII